MKKYQQLFQTFLRENIFSFLTEEGKGLLLSCLDDLSSSKSTLNGVLAFIVRVNEVVCLLDEFTECAFANTPESRETIKTQIDKVLENKIACFGEKIIDTTFLDGRLGDFRSCLSAWLETSSNQFVQERILMVAQHLLRDVHHKLKAQFQNSAAFEDMLKRKNKESVLVGFYNKLVSFIEHITHFSLQGFLNGIQKLEEEEKEIQLLLSSQNVFALLNEWLLFFTPTDIRKILQLSHIEHQLLNALHQKLIPEYRKLYDSEFCKILSGDFTSLQTSDYILGVYIASAVKLLRAIHLILGYKKIEAQSGDDLEKYHNLIKKHEGYIINCGIRFTAADFKPFNDYVEDQLKKAEALLPRRDQKPKRKLKGLVVNLGTGQVSEVEVPNTPGAAIDLAERISSSTKRGSTSSMEKQTQLFPRCYGIDLKPASPTTELDSVRSAAAAEITMRQTGMSNSR